ncbi:hypothetical protein DFQ05_1880 [Winogradskyella wandonensis]|uniref:peptidylprolyl isomerase n=1 Tax=Winogradskyella wandonensis TaxID=1442586 RepID=A0A4R1KNL7_9FLAO|nr:hypothetical protein [Winogradskyella wandonensis]TCK66612.1 hypothetical protein DFQ05_1880 [Winogradskyella wandonensis]
MKLRTFLTSIIVFSIIIFACTPDEPEINIVPERDRGEQQIVDDNLLQAYLSTHYYNRDDFVSGEDYDLEDIIILKLEDGQVLPPGSELLINAVETLNTEFQGVNYKYYILKINEGGGSNYPNFTDKIRVNYEGSLVADATVFDNQFIQDFNLVGENEFSGVITGWQRVFPNFKASEDFNILNNGIVDYDNYGFGVMFLPSGLGYFGRALEGIPVYSNLIFKFSLFQTEQNDHDNDGIPSYLEDLNEDLSVFDEDTDADNVVNYVDPDDDGDGVLTVNELQRTEYVIDTNMGQMEPTLGVNEFELTRTESMGIITITTGTIIDANNNNIPDYLDAEATTDYSEDN